MSDRILGIDPGKKGAFVIYDSEFGITGIWDMPVYPKQVGTGKGVKFRDEIDKIALIKLFNYFSSESQIYTAVLELVGQRPVMGKNGMRAQSGMFELGKSWMAVDMCLTFFKIPTIYTRPNEWKKDLKVPANKTEAVHVADRLLPKNTNDWRGPRGGLLDGRAEAALIALWGATKYKEV